MNRTLIAIAATAITLAAVAPAHAGWPADRTATYTLRAVPTSETSDIIFTVEFELTAIDMDGDDVGWRILSATFAETDTNGVAIRSWTKNDPGIDTPDGLWWISHDDGTAPTADEFTDVPYLSGRADANAGNDPDLDYVLAAGTLAQQYRTMFSGSVTALDSYFHEVEASQALIDDDDEPIEIGGSPNV
ncbi:MAG TPA: hypothetical protein P5572_10285 [Phycisphaerae bacterium]|nr:hypothetical protein [Phycisphaerales bacterium]HRX85394.1 hypothetical protein [Phycisphaerae bacterium]